MDNFLSPEAMLQIQKQINETNSEHRKELARRIQEAKDNLPEGKELFDLSVFETMYDLTDDDGDSIVTPQTISNLEEEYYLKYPDLLNMEAFAELKEEHSRHNVG
jgi:guanylate kinase